MNGGRSGKVYDVDIREMMKEAKAKKAQAQQTGATTLTNGSTQAQTV